MKIPTILHNLFPSRGNSSASIIVEGPTDNDVLCGRDRNFSKHTGNLLYRVQVERQASSYAIATTKQGKMKITKSIVQTMQTQYGSRFLRRTETNQWEVLTNVQARDKTSHALRFINNGTSSYSSHRTDEDSSEQIESKEILRMTQQDDTYQEATRAQMKNGETKCVVVPSLTRSCTSSNVDEAAIAAIHQRQQQLLRSSLQNDFTMDVAQNGHQQLSLENLLLSPVFTMSSFGAAPSNYHHNIGSNNGMSMTMGDVRSVGGGSDMMYYFEQAAAAAAAASVATPRGSFTSVPSLSQSQQHLSDDDGRFDSIRNMDMGDIFNGPMTDTLRSEDLNFLLNDSVMDEGF